MTARIVIHAGFHKTGTTSVQSLIHTNRRILERQVRCYLRPDFQELTDACRVFSVDPNPRTILGIADAAGAFFDGLNPDDPRGILMSSEDLSGHLPGRHGLDRYDAASLIMAQLTECIRTRFGDEVPLTYYFSTRGRKDWLRSTYWQNLRSTRLELGFEDYSQQIAPAADLPVVLDEVAEAVSPAAAVAALPLEESKDQPLGPLTPLMDLLDIPEVTRSKLRMLPPENVQPDLGLEDVFLALNRSSFKDRHLRAAKKLLRQLANKQSEND